jgi:hypothetical protein
VSKKSGCTYIHITANSTVKHALPIRAVRMNLEMAGYTPKLLKQTRDAARAQWHSL